MGIPHRDSSMKPKLLLSLLVATVLSFSPRCEAGGAFDSPVALFKEFYVPALEGFERATIATTWRGFVLRGDRQAKIEAPEPSESGISLDVEVRDGGEIPKLQDVTIRKDGLTIRTVRYPAAGSDPQALLVRFVYGVEANAEVVKAIEKNLEAIKKLPK